MNKPAQRPRSKPIPIHFRVEKGMLVPADGFAASQLRQKGYHIGDVVAADLRKLRNPKFNRLVHHIGQWAVANIEAFAGLDPHVAIKRLQIEGKIACDEIGIMVPGYGMVIQFMPRSLSFESMDEAEFQAVALAICRFISVRYWPTLTAEQIAEMAESFIVEA